MGKFIDLTGKRFGRLTVIKRGENKFDSRSKPITCWICKCDCGKTIVARSQNLRNGNSTSCGHCPKNTYDLTGDYGVGYTSNGIKFLFDLEDYNIIKKYNWCADKDKYIVSSVKIGNKNINIKMHRLIMNPSKDEQIDHINRDKWDNRKLNLRICNNAENNWNKTKLTNNKSGYKGVWWSKERHKWVASIKCNGRKYYIGRFNTPEEAHEAYKKKARELFGAFYCE